jgi:hypothetical protein
MRLMHISVKQVNIVNTNKPARDNNYAVFSCLTYRTQGHNTSIERSNYFKKMPAIYHRLLQTIMIGALRSVQMPTSLILPHLKFSVKSTMFSHNIHKFVSLLREYKYFMQRERRLLLIELVQLRLTRTIRLMQKKLKM